MGAVVKRAVGGVAPTKGILAVCGHKPQGRKW